MARLDSPYSLNKLGRNPPPAVIREVLAAKGDHPHHLIFKLAVDAELPDAKLARSWDSAVQIIVDCNLTYGWGSKPRRDRFRKLARDKRALAAIQGAVANSKDVPLDMLAVLVADGGAASIDALIPHLDPALVAADERLERLAKLRTHAKRTPVMTELLSEIDRTLEARDATSPALALGPVIGVGTVELLWFSVTIGSIALTHGNVPRVQGHVAIDSRKASWFGVSITDLGRNQLSDYVTTWFSATELDDALKVGRCDAAGLPVWLAKAAAHLGIAWSVPHISSGLRGAKRERIASWLLGGGRR